MKLDVLSGAEAVVAVGAIALVLAAALYVEHVRLGAANDRLVAVQNTVKAQDSQIKTMTANALETERRFNAQKEIVDAAQAKVLATESARTVAVASADGLFKRLADQRVRTSGNPQPPSNSASAPDTGLVPSIVYSSLVTRSRQLVGRTIDLANLADQREIAGTACEKAYDSIIK